MRRPLLSAAAIALTCATLSSFDVEATKVAWNVAIGAPGVAISVGAPALWGPAYVAPRPVVAVAPWVRPVAVVPAWGPVAAYPVVPYAVAIPYAAAYPMAFPCAAPAPVRLVRRAVVPAPVPRRPTPLRQVRYAY
jgi:hypothetical protein